MAMEHVKAIISLAASMSGDQDSGMGLAKDAVDKANLGLTTPTSTKFYHDDREIGAAEEYTLGSGSDCPDAFGNDQAFTKLHALYIKNDTGSDLTIGAGTNPVLLTGTAGSETIILPTGATFLYINPTGLTVQAGTSDDLKLAGTGGDVDIIIIG
ncbi:unnamed protein product, partial [marine sediment metagenome]